MLPWTAASVTKPSSQTPINRRENEGVNAGFLGRYRESFVTLSCLDGSDPRPPRGGGCPARTAGLFNLHRMDALSLGGVPTALGADVRRDVDAGHPNGSRKIGLATGGQEHTAGGTDQGIGELRQP